MSTIVSVSLFQRGGDTDQKVRETTEAVAQTPC
jgi:hypothetical protein